MRWLWLRKPFLTLSPQFLLWFCLAGRKPFVEAFKRSVKPTFHLYCTVRDEMSHLSGILNKIQNSLKTFDFVSVLKYSFICMKAHLDTSCASDNKSIWANKMPPATWLNTSVYSVESILYHSIMKFPGRKFFISFLLNNIIFFLNRFRQWIMHMMG